MVATHERRMDKRYQRDKSSTACETDHMKEKADVQNTTEHGKWMEENSRSAVQHAGRNGWTTCSVKECWVSLELLT